jgi:hypothetical protein
VHAALEITQPPVACQALARATAALDAAPLHPGQQGLGHVLACLATGRAQRVRPLLDTLDGPLLPIVAARLTAWTGRLGAAAAVWQRIRSPAPVAAAPDDDLELVFATAAAAGAERLATDLGDPAASASLHRATRELRGVLAQRRLTGNALLLAVSLDLLHPDACTDAYGTGGPLADGDAAGAILALAHGVLGLQPDAPRHRLWVRPRLPTAWTVLAVREIEAGEDSIALRVEREDRAGGGVLRVRMEQEAGPLPVTVLLEPYVPGRLEAARVDGQSASLAEAVVGGGCRVAAQLVLDHSRTLELEYGGRGGKATGPPPFGWAAP